MNGQGFMRGALFALGASLLGSVLYSALSPLFGSGWVLRLLVALLGLGYGIFLLRHCGQRAGRLVVLAAWAALAGGVWLAQPPLVFHLLAQVAAVWLVRSLYFHDGVLSAVADLVLSGLALATGFWAADHTGSLFLGLWCFFLVQALFVYIPGLQGRWRDHPPAAPDDPFSRAHRAAEGAVRKLTTTY
jgi:hypothetical protein